MIDAGFVHLRVHSALSLLEGALPIKKLLDLAKADLGDSLHISAVALPKGCQPTITDRDFTIATIAAPAGLKEVTEEESED